MRKSLRTACWLVAFATLPTGCVGDAVILRDVRGRILDRASGAPLPGAEVTAVLHTDSQDHPVVRNRGSTSPDGRFGIPVVVGSGSVAWIVFFPIIQGDRAAPKVETATIIVEHAGGKATVECSVDPRGQSATYARTPVNLGDLEVDLVKQGAP